jgi:hypothetical protein
VPSRCAQRPIARAPLYPHPQPRSALPPLYLPLSPPQTPAPHPLPGH